LDDSVRGRRENVTREEPFHDRTKSGVREVSEKTSEVNLDCGGTPSKQRCDKQRDGARDGII
jgi:hypothetical protein